MEGPTPDFLEMFGPEYGVMPAEKDAAPKIILDIGCGIDPIVGSRFRKVYSNETYFGIDGEEDEDLAKLHASNQGRQEVFNFIDGDGRRLDFPDSSVDCVCYKNVFGTNRLTVDDINRNAEKMLLEAARVLKERGELIIVEDITPDAIYNFYGSFQRFVSSINETTGLVKKSASGRDEVLREYTGEENSFGLRPFVLIMEKVKK